MCGGGGGGCGGERVEGWVVTETPILLSNLKSNILKREKSDVNR